MKTYKTDEQGKVGEIEMHPGDKLMNKDESHELVFQENGDVVIYCIFNNKPIYSIGTSGKKGTRLTFSKSRITLSTQAKKPIWQAWHKIIDGVFYEDYGFDGDEIFFREDGVLLITFMHQSKKIWSSGTVGALQVLHEADSMNFSKKLVSQNRIYELIISNQSLIIHNTSRENTGASTIRSRKIEGTPGSEAELRFINGKLKFGFTSGGVFRSLHESNNISPVNYVEISDAGSLLIFNKHRDLVWSSDRNFIKKFEDPFENIDQDLFPVNILTKNGGDRVLSRNGFYAFTLQSGRYCIIRVEDQAILYSFPPVENYKLLLDIFTSRRKNPVVSSSQQESIEFTDNSELSTENFLSLTDDGALVINHPQAPSSNHIVAWPRNHIVRGDILMTGHALYSGNKNYCFEWMDGQWKLYRVRDGVTLFSTNIKDIYRQDKKLSPKDFGVFLGDGCLLIGVHGIVHVFSTGFIYKTSAKPGEEPEQVDPDRLEVTNDGTLALFSGDEIVWKTPTSKVGKEDVRLDYLGGTRLVSSNKRFLLELDETEIKLSDSFSGKIIYRNIKNQPHNYYPCLISPCILMENNLKTLWNNLHDAKKKQTLSVADKWSENSIAVSDDGHIEIYESGRRIWKSFNNTMYSNEVLDDSNYLLSENGMFLFAICKQDGKPTIFSLANYSSTALALNKSSHRRNCDSYRINKISIDDGNLRFSAENNSPVWFSDTRDASSLHLSNEGKLSLLNDEGSIVWTTEKIVCLAWGSLVWDPGSLPTTGTWYADGPGVAVEFARQSQDGRITLVLQEGARPVPSLWGLMTSKDISEAITDLALREKIPTHKISETVGVWRKGFPSPPAIPGLASWAQSKQIDGIVWTNLPGKFRIKHPQHDASDHHELASSTISNPSKEQIVEYLSGLMKSRLPADKRKLHLAERYIKRTPRQINTIYREFIEAELGWKHDPYFE